MLTTPFINSLNAFDATKINNNAYVSVLGGDEITSLTYKIYNNQSTSTTPLYTNTLSISDDIAGESIRTFKIVIPANTLTNNGIYYITAETENSTLSETSDIARSAPFNCYVTPCLAVKYNDNGSYVPLTTDVVFEATSVPITLEFDTIDLNSPAILNSLKVTVYGVKSSGAFDIIYEGETLYNAPFAQTITGLSNTTTSNAIYQFYKLVVNAVTVDGMAFTQLNISETSTPIYANQILNLGCSFVEYGAGGNFYAVNDCDNGKVEVHYNILTDKNNPFDTLDITAMASDNSNVYCGSEFSVFSIYNKSSGAFGIVKVTEIIDSIFSIDVDDINVYCSGGYGTFAIYNKSSGTFGSSITTPFGTSDIKAIVGDDTNVYCGGADGKFAIYNKSSGTFGSLISNPFGTHSILAIANDDINVYCSSSFGEFAIYNKSSGTFGNLISNLLTNGIYSMASDNTNVYCGGFATFAIYNKSSGAFGSLISNPFGSSHVTSITNDDTNVYCGGADGKFAIYNKSSGAFGSLITTPVGTSDIKAIVGDDTNVYCGGADGKFAIYNKTFDIFYGISGSLISNPFGTSTLVITSDDTNVYCGSSGTFAIYNKSSGTFGSLITTPFGTSDILSMENDDVNVYCGSNGGEFAIYNKSSGTFGSLISNPFGTSVIASITNDDTNVYCGGGFSLSSSGKFAIYNKSSGTFGSLISNPFGSSHITSITNDDTNVYCGGKSGKFAIYNKSSGTFGSLITTPFGTSDILSMENDDVNVYCGGKSGKFAIYNKSSGTFGSLITTPFGTSDIKAIVGDDTNVYCGGADGKFAIYNKSSGTFGGLISNPFRSAIDSITNDDTNVYCGSGGAFAIYNIEENKFISNNYLILERKSTTETEWLTLDDNIQFSSFILYDTYNQNNVVYTYRLRASNVTNASITCIVLSQFYNSYICDSTTMYNIINELEYDSEETVQVTTLYTPIGSKFPFVGANAKTRYRSGQITAILLAVTSKISGYIDRMAQVNLKNAFNAWLTNHRGKIIKDYNGNITVASVQNAVSNNYYKELGNGIASTKFDYAEIAELKQSDLQKLGMLNRFLITYSES